MLNTILCYNSEKMVTSWTKEEDDAVMEKLIAVQDKLARQRKLGPVARLGPTTTARTVRKDSEPFLVTDGPYAETKEQILGFYMVDLDSADDAIEFALELAAVNPGGPLRWAMRSTLSRRWREVRPPTALPSRSRRSELRSSRVS